MDAQWRLLENSQHLPGSCSVLYRQTEMIQQQPLEGSLSMSLPSNAEYRVII